MYASVLPISAVKLASTSLVDFSSPARLFLPFAASVSTSCSSSMRSTLRIAGCRRISHPASALWMPSLVRLMISSLTFAFCAFTCLSRARRVCASSAMISSVVSSSLRTSCASESAASRASLMASSAFLKSLTCCSAVAKSSSVFRSVLTFAISARTLAATSSMLLATMADWIFRMISVFMLSSFFLRRVC